MYAVIRGCRNWVVPDCVKIIDRAMPMMVVGLYINMYYYYYHHYIIIIIIIILGTLNIYRKIPILSPGLILFRKHFLGGLFTGRAYYRDDICV